MRRRWIGAIAAGCGVLFTLASPVGAQELEELVDESEREEAEIRRIPGTKTPGFMPEGMDSRLRLPEDEGVQRLRIAQDREIDAESHHTTPCDAFE